ncbi:MAG: hypothetical protein LWY06_20715 [Firmicutes bacterium]|nr:hypothetical protein [Bacillota bacterium]
MEKRVSLRTSLLEKQEYWAGNWSGFFTNTMTLGYNPGTGGACDSVRFAVVLIPSGFGGFFPRLPTFLKTAQQISKKYELRKTVKIDMQKEKSKRTEK